MTKRPSEPSQLDPQHPLIRRMVRTVQLRDRAVANASAADMGMYARSLALDVEGSRLAYVGTLLLHVASHIKRAAPRVEHDEAAQLLITADDGAPIGRLRRPATLPDLLHPVIEAAVDRFLAGHDGQEGDSDADSEREPLHEETETGFLGGIREAVTL